MVSFSWHTRGVPEGLRELLLAARAIDGRPLIDDHGPLPATLRDGPHLVAMHDGSLVGYAHLDPHGDAFDHVVAELLVRPDARNQGIGRQLLSQLLSKADALARTNTELRVWAHGDHPAAATLAARAGLRRARELLRLRISLTGELPRVALPAGVRLRSFVPGADEPAVVEVNREAFVSHPEQGRMSIADLRRAQAESSFDAAGFLLAVDASDRVLGFHWTKAHRDVDGGPMGEVYVVGVRPDAQGGGLGKALTVAGLEYLAGRGLTRVMLYVESDNGPARAVYAKLGFTEWDADVQYSADIGIHRA